MIMVKDKGRRYVEKKDCIFKKLNNKGNNIKILVTLKLANGLF